MELRAAIRKLPFAQSAYAAIRLALGRNARFSADYHRNSGIGSTVSATKGISRALPSLLNELSVKSVLDIPCGDFVWMRGIDLRSINYIGADIIDILITSHQALYGSDRRHFKKLDVLTADLPQTDLILCRDCLVHFSHRLVKKALNNIRRSGSQYLLTTTFPRHRTNNGIVTGSWQPLNLSAQPFHLPPPMRLLDEGHPTPWADKSLGLWRIADLPVFT